MIGTERRRKREGETMGFMKRLLEESWQKDRKEDRRRFQQWLPKTKEKKDGLQHNGKMPLPRRPR